MRRHIMAANWKMYKTPQETTQFFDHFRKLDDHGSRCEVVIFPSCIDVTTAVACAAGTKVEIGGQNIYPGKEGAFTGETSAGMLSAAGAKWVLVGHSERRHVVACETDAEVLKKAQAALSFGLTPIICVGERTDEHKAGKTDEVLIKQFAGGIAGLTEEQFAQIVIAYEPLWAIGTGMTATPKIASEAHKLIRAEAAKRFGVEAAQEVRVLYGGSVKPDNVEGLMAESELDGALVGGASLDPDSFMKLVRAA
jgi:triosephosphate isomerase